MRAPLIELCAGSAAVSLRWLRSDARPPLAYQGGKRGYADAILSAMGLHPGGGYRDEVILVEPGHWGEAWDLWRTPAGRADTIARLRAWTEEDPRALWERLRAAPVPGEGAERVAVWAVLMLWVYANQPSLIRDGQWFSKGFDRSKAYKEEYTLDLIARGSPAHMQYKSLTLADVIEGLETLPPMERLRVLRCDARDVRPIPGAIVYIDPPYAGTTCAYGHSLPRGEVEALALRWHHAGARVVAVSEQEPLPLPGWHAHELGGPSGFGRTWSKQRREFLTLSKPPAGQQSLFPLLDPEPA